MVYTIAALEAELPGPEMKRLVAEILASSLKSLGLLGDGVQNLAPHHEQWLKRSLAYLREQNVLDREVRPLAELWSEWEARRPEWAADPTLEACLEALPDILSGKARAEAIVSLASPLRQAGYFRDVLARTLAACIEQQLQADPKRKIRILEIGAGPGDTTAALLPVLQRYPIEEYCCTDVSNAFLSEAKERFQFPALTTAIFDVSMPLDSQSIAANHYDFAIAAGALHAAPNIREALRNVKATLKNQGVLLLDEISTWSLFHHVTFGLLAAWWEFEDAGVRLAGSRGLAPESWRTILREEGFESIVFPAEHAHEFGRQIVAAVSDGWTRQRIVKPLVKPIVQPVVQTIVQPVVQQQPAIVAAPPGAAAPDRPAPMAAPAEQWSAEYTRRIITAKLSEALRMDAATIRDDASFADYGVDSIVGVNLVRTISEALQIELEAMSLFEYSTVEDLTQFILTNWRERIAAQMPRTSVVAESPARTEVAAPAEVAVRPGRRFTGKTRFAEVRSAFDAAAESGGETNSTEPIAIVGMSGRFAESESLDVFWQHLSEGKDLVKEVTRWDPEDCVTSEVEGHGYCHQGSFVDSIDLFDPGFFGIARNEATYMDPQQRLFLEESWKALENAGYGGKDVQEKQCGVYVGCGSSQYDKLASEEAPAFAFWGNSQSVIPARIAYCLNLQGPAIAVDTACSSSLVAIHLACQGLWSREMEMALAGGVFLQPTAGFYQVANRAGMLSPDGKTRSFDAGANGFVPGEGVGVVVLKRLSDALTDGDHILGVIAGTGINQDGKSNGLTAPNVRAQERLERHVYDRFKINPETIQFVEAHGTGTLFGDSIEYGALSRAFRGYTDKKQFCAIGSVKTNIGHTSTAAGVASVLKLLLSLQHRQIPPSLHFEKSNPGVDLASGPFYVNTQLKEWEPEGGAIRRAAASSFGFSGTNAHLVIEEAPAIERRADELPGYLVVLSARSSEQLKQQARNLVTHLERTPGLSMTDASFTLFAGRMHHNHRLACLARNQNELMRSLGQWIETGAAGQVYVAEIQEGKVREQISLKKFGNYCIQQCNDAPDAATYLENLAAVAELYVQGYALDYPALFPRTARRTPLPTYPFARERYWLDEDAAVIDVEADEPELVQYSDAQIFATGVEGDLRAAVQSELLQMVMEFLNLPAGDVAPDRVLVDLGFDSISLTNFANAINEKYGLDLTPVLFFEYPSLSALAGYLAEDRGSEIRRTRSDVAPAPRAIAPPRPVVKPARAAKRKKSAAYCPELRFVNQPIAIVGIAGVMPQSENLDVLWANLKNAMDLVAVIPEDRWHWEDYYGDPFKEVNKSNSKWGGFMKEIDKFDPLFFGISPREAQMMDPQQRIFLETVWSAVEDSGQKVSELAGTRTGLFVGVGSNDYLDLMRNRSIALDGYTASGNSHAVLANRVSYLLNLRGPSAPIDTACSSSLVALHRAIESIHTGSCDMAIVGGVQVIMSPGGYISFGMAGMLSSDGKCKAFDKRANGYVRGEGCGAMLIKPLSKAEADGNHIYAIIKGTSENHGGRVTTMVAPNAAAQTALLIDAYEKAQIDPATVGYIECHGTGTSLGDPIEIQGLSRAFSELYGRRNQVPADEPHCGLGTIKTNIGHLETAAGIAGLLKVLLAMKHKEIPANIHFESLNPYISLKGTPFYIVDRLTPWKAVDGLPRRAGVSSFGFGGANAHAVLEEYIPPHRESPALAHEPQLIVLSAKNDDRLRAYVQSMRAYLDGHETELADLAYTLQVGRDEMPERVAFVVSGTEDLKRKFDQFLEDGGAVEGCYRATAPSSGIEGDASLQTAIERKELSRLAELWVSGVKIDWRLLYKAGLPRRISAPTYPFARQRYWMPDGEAKASEVRQDRAAIDATPRRDADQPRVAAVQEEVEVGLLSMVPIWNAVRPEAGTRVVVPESSNILLVGGDPKPLAWVRQSFPMSQHLELPANADIDEIVKKLGGRSFDQLLWVAPDMNPRSGGGERIIDQQEEGVLAVFRIIKALLHLGYANKNLQWTFLINRTLPVTGAEILQPVHAGIAGLVGSLAKEYPQWNLRVLDLDSLTSASADECLSLPWDKRSNALARRDGEWFRQGLAAMTAPPQATPVYRKNGVYVVIGGAGGVGEVWTRFMVEQYQANVVWIGRRPYDAAIEGKIKSLSRLGPAPQYISADATNPDALAKACATILETHSAIHGVVHSALVLGQSISRMDEPAFRAGLSAKIDISVNMDSVFGGQKLDFMLFFSSTISFFKAPGQSNYAAGSTFEDSFAHALQQRRTYPVRTINWGYWGTVGVVADEAFNKSFAQMGIGSIEPHEGMAALQLLLGSDLRQMALYKTLTGAATAGLNLSETVAYYAKTAPAILPGVQQALAGRISEEPLVALEAQQPSREMNDLVTELLASCLVSLGLFRNGVNTIAALPQDKRPPLYFERWLSGSVAYLQQQKVLGSDLTIDREVRAAADLWPEWEAKRPLWTTDANQQAQINLLEVCLKALPDVLRGKQSATNVMFPNSSMRLVEGVYRDNLLANYVNDVLGQTLIAGIEKRLQEDPDCKLRILEIGAGTGGTTATILPMLQRFPVVEYCYTDLSKLFLMLAEKQFKPSFPALTTAILDISKPLASQSVATDHYDFAVAANVLHATNDIRETLRNAKAALKNQGVLLLNELSTWSLFSHLTFGLLEGWWLFEDTALRLPGGPALAPEKWRQILAEEGFDPILFPAEEAHRFGQQIIAAASDGWTRQRIVKRVAQQRSAVGEHADAKAPEPAATQDARTVKSASPSGETTDQRCAAYVRGIIIENLSEALRMEAAAIRGDVPVTDYGLDSIIGVNLVRTISETLQIELETASLFEYSTIDLLTQYILDHWRDQVAAQLPQVSRSTEEGPAILTAEPVAGVPSTVDSGRESDAATVSIEPIAIVGMSGRFAASESLDAFWRNLEQGRDLVRKVSRWDAADCVASRDPAQAYCSDGSFIDSIDRFDPAFFGISADEATHMDPQQRLFLEEAWKALENGGYAGKDVHEKQCGVYVGCANSDYDSLVAGNAPGRALWGSSESAIAARIASHLDLRGPAIAVNTACSSSLVAIHLACQSLWSRETEMALAGGVSLQATPGFYRSANAAGLLSPDGKCHSFDSRANGFVPGEGVGVLVLKRLRDALEDGDHIHGVIAGTGVDQDGNANGRFALSVYAQERLERSVYDRFRIHPETIQVVEAHGTGTESGDSIEYAAISRALGESTNKKQFCAIGTVKTNIGHAGAAAGVAGILKLLLSLKHRQIPPTLHFRKSNPAIDFESGPFYVNTRLKEWRVDGDRRRRAAVSAFGAGGTNAHVVIEEAPAAARTSIEAPGYVLALSARTAEQLRQQAANLLAHLNGASDISLNDLSFTLLVGRRHFNHRLAWIGRDRQEVIALLERWIDGGAASQIYASEIQEFREHATLKKAGDECIRTCRNGTNAAAYVEHLATIADLYSQGYSLEFSQLFSRGSRRVPLPTYPFAEEYYWIDGAGAARLRAEVPETSWRPPDELGDAAPAENGLSDVQILQSVLWRETTLDGDYEKVTF